jgi:hypothetical protein
MTTEQARQAVWERVTSVQETEAQLAALERVQRDKEAHGEFEGYNTQRPHQGRWCYGKTPMQTFIDSVSLAKEKRIA